MRFILDDDIYTHVEEPPQISSLNVVMTRVSMVLPGFRERGGFEEEKAFQDYITTRTPIFKKICLASMRTQSMKPDLWLIGFDATRRDAVEAVLKLVAPYPWIVPVWQNVVEGSHEPARNCFVHAIKQHLKPHHRHVISARIDNDDALSRGFCESVVRYSAAVLNRHPDQDDFWISFPIGLQYDGTDCRYYTFNNNPFLARCEAVSKYAGNGGGSAMQGNHGHVFKRGKVFLPITRYPMWLQYIHSSNVSNASKSALPVLRDGPDILARFGLNALSAQ